MLWLLSEGATWLPAWAAIPVVDLSPTSCQVRELTLKVLTEPVLEHVLQFV